MVFGMIFALSYLFADMKAYAQTEVSGIISQDTAWTKEGSPYIIKGNVLVDTGMTLNITEGAEILFGGDFYIQIQGKIIAIGTEQENIVFANSSDVLQARGYIELKSNDNELNYCTMNNGDYYFSLKVSGQNNMLSNLIIQKGLYIQNCGGSCFDNIFVDSINISAGSRNIIKNCYVKNLNENPTWWNNGIYITQSDSNKIQDCIVESEVLKEGDTWRNDSGIVLDGSSDNEITFCRIYNNQMAGICIYSGTGNIIQKCNINNNKYGIMIYSNCNNTVRKCNVQENRAYNLLLGADEGDFDITNNYWGAINKSEISDMIHDYFDDFNCFKAVFEPFLTIPYGSDLVNSNYPSDTYTTPIDVELSVTGDGYDIYYTSDGTDPKTNGIKYTAPIHIDKTTDIKAVTVKDDVYSEVTTYSYQIVKPPLPYTINDITFTNLNGDPVTPAAGNFVLANVEVIKNDTSTTPGLLMIALYDSNNVLKNISFMKINLSKGQSTTFGAGIKLPTDMNGYKVKAFVWEGLGKPNNMSNSAEYPKI